MARRKKAESPKPDLVRICIISSDASQDRFLPREVAKAYYEAGELARDMDSKCDYCLPSKYYDPLKDRYPRLPAFLVRAERMRY